MLLPLARLQTELDSTTPITITNNYDNNNKGILGLPSAQKHAVHWWPNEKKN